MGHHIGLVTGPALEVVPRVTLSPINHFLDVDVLAQLWLQDLGVQVEVIQLSCRVSRYLFELRQLAQEPIRPEEVVRPRPI